MVENVSPSDFGNRFCFSNYVPFVKTVKWEVVQDSPNKNEKRNPKGTPFQKPAVVKVEFY